MQNWKSMKKAAGILAAIVVATSMTALAQGSATILKPADTTKLIPASVFYRGQSATTQLRNSGGVKFSDGYFVLTTLVDTSGYSTGVAAKYQAYFITEVPLTVAGKHLGPGAYGIGFIEGDKFLVTDIGGHDVLSVASASDKDLKRPMPLEVTTDATGGYRLYAGRKYVVFKR